MCHSMNMMRDLPAPLVSRACRHCCLCRQFLVVVQLGCVQRSAHASCLWSSLSRHCPTLFHPTWCNHWSSLSWQTLAKPHTPEHTPGAPRTLSVSSLNNQAHSTLSSRQPRLHAEQGGLRLCSGCGLANHYWVSKLHPFRPHLRAEQHRLSPSTPSTPLAAAFL